MEGRASQDDKTIWTIGHSNHPLEAFLDLLAGTSPRSVGRRSLAAPIRATPRSSTARRSRPALTARGIRYLFLGDLLGGRAEDERFYDDQGRVLYDRLAESPGFRQGIERLLGGMRGRSARAILCGEEDPTDCHRRLLVGRVLQQRGVARAAHPRRRPRAERGPNWPPTRSSARPRAN